jgi:hypothetical protein
MVLYAIPSYNRPDGLYKKTLTVLKDYNIPSKDITIFLHSNEDKELYESTIPKDMYGKIVVHNLPKGIGKVRNFIMDYYPLKTEYVSLDDDVTGFLEAVNGKLKPIKSFKDLVTKGFSLCKKNGFSLWGLYPVCNAFFMKGEPVTTDLRFIVGGCMGMINRGKERHVTLNMKEDYELTLMSNKEDGGVIRFNTICVKHNTNSKKGGIGQDQKERVEEYKKAAAYLMKKYPDSVILNKKREGEILLVRKKASASKNKTLKKTK